MNQTRPRRRLKLTLGLLTLTMLMSGCAELNMPSAADLPGLYLLLTSFKSTDGFITVFSAVVAISTVVYAGLTRQLVAETRKLRQVQTEPRVNIRVEGDHSGHHGLELTIRNEGQGVAKNVQFKFDGDPSYFRKEFKLPGIPVVSELTIIKNGLDYLEPRQVYRFFIGMTSSEDFELAVKKPWKFCVKYEDLYGKCHTDNHTVDFSLFRGTRLQPNHLEEISEQLKEISRHLMFK